MKKEDKKEGPLKRLKNIEDKSEEQLKAINSKNENIKEVTDFVKEPLSLELKGLIEEIRIVQKDVDYRKLKITGGNKNTYDFSDYNTFKELFRELYHRNVTIDEAERKQDEFNAVLDALSVYSVKKKEYIEAKNKLLNNAKKFYKGREKVIDGFKNGIFPLSYDQREGQEFRNKEEENKMRNKNGLIDYKKLNRLINPKNRDINDELVIKHFPVQHLGALLEKF